jgi:hypothetical protein
MSKTKENKPVIKTGVVVEGVDMRTYRSVENPRHVAGVTYRSVNEAFKGWEYACAVEKHKSDFRHALEFFSDILHDLVLDRCGFIHANPICSLVI